MPTIGSFSVLSFGGRLRPAVRKVATLETAPGVDGNAVVVAGWTQAPQEIRTVQQYSSAAVAASALNAYRGLSGTVVNVVDQFAFAWPNVTVLGVTGEISAVGYGGLYRLDAAWLLLPQTTRPS